MNADEIIGRVRDLAYIPATTAFTDQKILDAVNAEMHSVFAAALVRASGELLTEEVDIAIVAGQANYGLPQRALMSTVRQVTWVDGGGYERPNLIRLELSNISRYSQISGNPLAFHLTATEIVLHPTPAANIGSMRLRYSHRMADLIPKTLNALGQSTSVSIIQGVSLYDLAVSTPTSGWPASVAVTGQTPSCDIVGWRSPHKIKGIDLAVGLATPGSSTVSLVVAPTTLGIESGDYLTQAGASYVPQCPDEWHELLCLFGAGRMALLRKDFGLRDQILTLAQGLERELVNASQPRTKQNSKHISAWAGGRRARSRW